MKKKIEYIVNLSLKDAGTEKQTTKNFKGNKIKLLYGINCVNIH